MRPDQDKSKKLKDYIAPILMGVSGALMGSTFGSGVGRSLPELLLALFLIIFASIFSQENIVVRSREHLLILISGAVFGLAIEYFTQSTIIVVIGGAVVGILTLPMLSMISSIKGQFIRTAPLVYYAILIIIVFAILTPIYFWASSRGILRETLIALAFLSSPLWVGYIFRKLSN